MGVEGASSLAVCASYINPGSNLYAGAGPVEINHAGCERVSSCRRRAGPLFRRWPSAKLKTRQAACLPCVLLFRGSATPAPGRPAFRFRCFFFFLVGILFGLGRAKPGNKDKFVDNNGSNERAIITLILTPAIKKATQRRCGVGIINQSIKGITQAFLYILRTGRGVRRF